MNGFVKSPAKPSGNAQNPKDTIKQPNAADYAVHIIEQGIAQHSGKQTGTTAAPDLLVLFDLLPDSYS